jgi:hypothetical protein
MDWTNPDPEEMAQMAQRLGQVYNQDSRNAGRESLQGITFVPAPEKTLASFKAEDMDLARSLFTSQYEALRSEINQRLDLRQQLLTYTLIVAGTLFGLGLQSWMSGFTILCYPILACFLAGSWAQHDIRIGQIAKFLRELEDRYLGGDGWESYRRCQFGHKKHPLSSGLVELPTRGLFLVSQVLAVVLGIARSLSIAADQIGMWTLFTLLLVIDATAIAMTVYTVRHRRERTPGQPTSPFPFPSLFERQQ